MLKSPAKPQLHLHSLSLVKQSKGQKQKDLGPPFYLGNFYLLCTLLRGRHVALWPRLPPASCSNCDIGHGSLQALKPARQRRGMSRESNPRAPIPPSQLTNALPLRHGGPLLQRCLELWGFAAAFQLRNRVLKIASRGGVLQLPAVSQPVAMVLQSIGCCEASKGLKIAQKASAESGSRCPDFAAE